MGVMTKNNVLIVLYKPAKFRFDITYRFRDKISKHNFCLEFEWEVQGHFAGLNARL